MKLLPGTRLTEQRNEPDIRVAAEPLQLTAATPERLSETDPASRTLEAITVEPSAGEVMLITGGVSSMFRLSEVLALLSALSSANPETTWFAPSAETVMGDGHEATPDKLSEQLKLTVTAELFHPA